MAHTATSVMTAAGQGPWIQVNLNSFRFGVGLIAVFNTNGIVGATCLYSVLVTGQDPKDNLASGYTGAYPFGSIFGVHDVLKSLAGSANSSLAYPCTALALSVSQLTAGAQVALSVIQVVN